MGRSKSINYTYGLLTTLEQTKAEELISPGHVCGKFIEQETLRAGYKAGEGQKLLLEWEFDLCVYLLMMWAFPFTPGTTQQTAPTGPVLMLSISFEQCPAVQGDTTFL